MFNVKVKKIQYCPSCLNIINPPKVNQYEGYFTCKECNAMIRHKDNDVMLGFILFFIVMVGILSFMRVNVVLSMSLTIITYHFIRPLLFESYFRLEYVKGA